LTLWVFYLVYLILTSNDKEDDSYSWVILKEENNKTRKTSSENYFDSNVNSSKENYSKEKEKEKEIKIKEVKENENIHKNLFEDENKILEKEKYSFEEISNKSIDHFKIILRERSKEKSIDNTENGDENKQLISNKLDLEKFNYYKHSCIKNVSLKINSYESFGAFITKGILKVTSKPWEMFMDLFVPKSDEGYSLILGFLIPMFFIWNFSELELFILSKVLSRLKVPASFLGFTIMSWGNNAPDM